MASNDCLPYLKKSYFAVVEAGASVAVAVVAGASVATGTTVTVSVGVVTTTVSEVVFVSAVSPLSQAAKPKAAITITEKSFFMFVF
jgi:hypothetical protein